MTSPPPLPESLDRGNQQCSSPTGRNLIHFGGEPWVEEDVDEDIDENK